MSKLVRLLLLASLLGCATTFYDGKVAGTAVRVTEGGAPTGPRDRGTLPPQVLHHIFTASDSPTRAYGNIEDAVAATIPAMNQALARDGSAMLSVSNQLVSVHLDRSKNEVWLNLHVAFLVTTHRFDVSGIPGVFDGASGAVDPSTIKYLGHD